MDSLDSCTFIRMSAPTVSSLLRAWVWQRPPFSSPGLVTLDYCSHWESKLMSLVSECDFFDVCEDKNEGFEAESFRLHSCRHWCRSDRNRLAQTSVYHLLKPIQGRGRGVQKHKLAYFD